MGLFSKLMGGDKELENAAKDLFNGILNNMQKEAENQRQNAPAQPAAEQNVYRNAPESVQKQSGPSGFSWGEDMPDEENQYNYNGPFAEYFENIFRAEFPQYRLEREDIQGMKRVIFTFYEGAGKALVVELMPQSSAAKKLRETCAKEGVPYLRYYYDHQGWWNTRAYVTQRTKNALSGN